jgi:hypothetical protein
MIPADGPQCYNNRRDTPDGRWHMRLGFLLAMTAGLLLTPFLAYETGVPADDDLSQQYVQTIDGIRYQIVTYNAKDSFLYEKSEILGTLGEAGTMLGHFVVTLPARVRKH